MEWKLLKSNKCPQCRKDLSNAKSVETSTGPGVSHACGFTIGNHKFSEIVADRVSKDLLYPDAEIAEEDFL